MTWILGIAPSHDASAVLFRDGTLVAAIAEERLTRIKGDGGRLPGRAIDAVLEAGGIGRGDVDHLALIAGRLPDAYFRRPTFWKELERGVSRLRRRLGGAPPRATSVVNLQKNLRSRGLDTALEPWLRQRRFLAREGFRSEATVRFFDHHETHAILAAFYSGFEEAAVITMDGEGDLDIHHTSSVYRRQTLERCHLTDAPGTSAGKFYMHVTALLGFRPLRHEGKVLGLAAFGDPEPLYTAFARALRRGSDGRTLDSDFRGLDRAEARRRDYLRDLIKGHPREDVAAAAQKVLEDAVVPLVEDFVAETGVPRVALNGGVFANVKLNQRIAALTGVERIFVFPGMSDTGNSLGAALLRLEELEPGFLERHRHELADVYWGPAYADDEITAALAAAGMSYRRLDREALVETAARAIQAGRVVGWFQGRTEFGPRALGNRSIVARATEAGINRWLNDRLHRTEFMPFAPTVLGEYAAGIFHGVERACHPAEFMTVTFDVRPEWRARIPAVVHVDGTARPQLVFREKNPLYYDLIERYRQLSGIPVVLNTSFNVHEEPIVCAPAEAVAALAEDRVDCLAIGPFWAEGSDVRTG